MEPLAFDSTDRMVAPATEPLRFQSLPTRREFQERKQRSIPSNSPTFNAHTAPSDLSSHRHAGTPRSTSAGPVTGVRRTPRAFRPNRPEHQNQRRHQQHSANHDCFCHNNPASLSLARNRSVTRRSSFLSLCTTTTEYPVLSASSDTVR